MSLGFPNVCEDAAVRRPLSEGSRIRRTHLLKAGSRRAPKMTPLALETGTHQRQSGAATCSDCPDTGSHAVRLRHVTSTGPNFLYKNWLGARVDSLHCATRLLSSESERALSQRSCKTATSSMAQESGIHWLCRTSFDMTKYSAMLKEGMKSHGEFH